MIFDLKLRKITVKPIKPSITSEFHSLHVVTLTSGQDRDSARWLMAMLHALDIVNVDNVCSLSKVHAALREGDVDVIVVDVAEGGLMVPSSLKTLDAASGLKRFPHVLWIGQPTLRGTEPTQRNTVQGKPTGPRIGGVSLAALALHARLAQQVGVTVGMVYGGGKAAFADALRGLLLAPKHPGKVFAPVQLPTEADVIDALTTGKNLRVMLQPQYDLRTRRIIGAEALLRWHHPHYGEVPPSVLIPMVNQLGLHLLLFSFIETRVIHALLSLKKRNRELPIALNASSETTCTPGLPERLAEKMQRAGLAPQLLKIELTGDMPVADELSLSASLNNLRAKGFPVSLDDFGQGAATLNLLAKMSFDEVKIDGVFVRDMRTNASSRAVILAIVSLAKAMNLKVVAEGIEDEACIVGLLNLGCRSGQGFALARPMEVDDFLSGVDKEQE